MAKRMVQKIKRQLNATLKAEGHKMGGFVGTGSGWISICRNCGGVSMIRKDTLQVIRNVELKQTCKP